MDEMKGGYALSSTDRLLNVRMFDPCRQYFPTTRKRWSLLTVGMILRTKRFNASLELHVGSSVCNAIHPMRCGSIPRAVALEVVLAWHKFCTLVLKDLVTC